MLHEDRFAGHEDDPEAAGLLWRPAGRSPPLRWGALREPACPVPWGGTSPIGPRTGLAAARQTRLVLDAGADGGLIAGRTVRTAMAGQAAPEDYLNDTRAVLNGG